MKQNLRRKHEDPHAACEDGVDARQRRVLITGGAGFIGCNLAHRLLSHGIFVRIFDNFSRRGAERNAQWLRQQHHTQLEIIHGDVRDPDAVRWAMADVDWLFHFAAQEAVTTSLISPVEDFEVNARGTLNVLEAMREMEQPPSLLLTSTNKVYGDLSDVPLTLEGDRYQPADPLLRERGIGEDRRLDFHSPYGCSKGAADQYVLDYGRIFGLRTTVFRMSCIYGPHQHGTEDQGWVAFFIKSALAGSPITIYGDGCQVRDALYVEDLVEAMVLAQMKMHPIAGQAFNIGGGPANTISINELVAQLEQARLSPELKKGRWRPGDQKYYVSDISRFCAATAWRPRVAVREGIELLHAWLAEHASEAQPVAAREAVSL